MQTTGDPDRDRARRYHIRRAQTRKALTERLRVEWERMDSAALWLHAIQRQEQLVASLGEGTDRELVYAARFVLGALLELHMRGEQLQFEGMQGPALTAGGNTAAGPYTE